MVTGLWSPDEHADFLLAIKLYPRGPWRKVAAYIGTRSVRQVQTHAQKYHEKVVRRMRGLHKGRRYSGREEHRIDDDMLAACKLGEGFGVLAPRHSRPVAPMKQQQHHTVVPPLLESTDFRPVRLRDATLGSMSPSGVDSNGIADTLQRSLTCGISCWLPTIDESLDFLIDRLLVEGSKCQSYAFDWSSIDP
ncbi:unnamed protein product [Hyaloperonospora brassicae]|uniref:HTH myb-type domain-containing protein n=1 Tax=Hyaloperonospora brassicae TaxID=162125 RepID=A0AAV0V188_HYABA|nr:unnamed protein product [Hyaloperonospora brassicae]